jgi:hypothetical protein
MYLRALSQYAILLPICFGFIVFSKAGYPYRLFLFLLVYGFVSDVLVGWQEVDMQVRFFIFNFYSLIETAVILIFISALNITESLTRIARWLLLILLAAWLVLHYRLFAAGELKFSAVYESIYTLCISLLSVFALLKMSEKSENIISAPSFWFLIAFFINCFCIFFIKNFMEAALMRKLLYITNILNVINYLILSAGYLLLRKTPEKRRHLI